MLKPRRLHGSSLEITGTVQARPGESYRQAAPSMFIGNEFEAIMHNRGTTTVVMIGCTTEAASR